MALISIAIYDTPDNGRDVMTQRTLESLLNTVDFTRHRIFLVINASTDLTRAAISEFGSKCPSLEVIYAATNVGTARAVNKGWKHRRPGEHCLKMDNDVVIHNPGWLDLMEQCIEADPKIGVIGLRRPDLRQSPNDPDPFYRCYTKRIVVREKVFPECRVTGSVTVEETYDVMGTCVLHNAALLDKVGYLYQPGLYGFDDVLMCIRSIQAGFYNCFLSREHVQIDHIDPGDGEYQDWKSKQAWADSPEYNRLKEAYRSGKADLYCPAEY